MKLLFLIDISICGYCLVQMHECKMQYEHASTSLYDYEYLNDVLNDHFQDYKRYKTALLFSLLVLVVTIVL